MIGRIVLLMHNPLVRLGLVLVLLAVTDPACKDVPGAGRY